MEFKKSIHVIFNRTKKYNVNGVRISSSIPKEQGLLDNSFYDSNVKIMDGQLEKRNPFSVIETENRELIIKNYGYGYRENSQCVSYITDLHLNHKIKKRFPEYASRQEIIDYIREMVHRLKDDFRLSSDTLLIGGDVSFNFEFSKKR